MHEATRHRGPDDEGFFESPDMSFAHNRLSILDLTAAGHQPMASPDGRYVIIFNGEIYNYRELRSDLETVGEAFVSTSDTEVLLRLFMREGTRMLSRLRGIFAFAIWDKEKKELTLARDHFGVKPLYYFEDKGRLIFSSELKALLTHPIARQLDPHSVARYFQFLYVPGPATMFQGIKKLSPGHYATWRDGQLSIHRWYQLAEGVLLTNREEAIDRIRSTVREAVRSQLISDRPIGVFLSGGIDSTLILSLMREFTSGPIKTFSMGYVSDVQSEKYNADFTLARQTAELYGTDHHAYTLTAEDALPLLEKTIYHMDEPVANHVQTSTYMLAAKTRYDAGVPVVLGGDGGDELFGGYPRYWYDYWMNFLTNRVRWPAGPRRYMRFMSQKQEILSRFLGPELMRKTMGVHPALNDLYAIKWKDKTNQLMAADVQTWLADESLIRSDRLTMAHGLEQRVPFLDPELVKLAFSISSRWKIGTRKQGKKILIDAFKKDLPAHVLHQEKRAWMSPASKWIRGPMLPFMREVLSPGFVSGTEHYIHFEGVQKILEDHLSSRQYALHTLWSVMTFQLWCAAYRPIF